MKGFESQGIALSGQSRIVPVTLVAQKSIGPVHLVPLVVHLRLFQARTNPSPAVKRNVGVLPPPNVKQFAVNTARALERIVPRSSSQAPFVNVRRIETSGGPNIGVHRASECQVSADADSHYSKRARTICTPLQVSKDPARILVIRRQLFRGLVSVPLSAPAWSYASTVPAGSNSS